MGRAIDMENKTDALEVRVKKLESTLENILSTITTKTNIDLTDKGTNEKEKTNNEGSAKSSKSANSRRRKSANANS